ELAGLAVEEGAEPAVGAVEPEGAFGGGGGVGGEDGEGREFRVAGSGFRVGTGGVALHPRRFAGPHLRAWVGGVGRLGRLPLTPALSPGGRGGRSRGLGTVLARAVGGEEAD